MYTKVFEIIGVARLLLAAMLVMAGGAVAASIGDCPGGLTIKGGGVIECAGASFASCAGKNILLDSLGSVGCIVPGLPPTCTLTPAATTLASGGTVTLSASCPTATGYTWTGGTCAGSGVTCIVTAGSTSGTTTYTVAGTSAGGTGTAASATVTVGTATKPTCTLTPALSTIVSGASSILTASCSPTATSYIWTGGTCAGITTSTSTCTVTPTSTTSYTVKGTNTAGTGTAASATVTVTAPSSTVPTCTLSKMQFGAGYSLTASCNPAASSYVWSANTGFASTSSGGLIAAPTVTTTYSVTGKNAAGTAGNTSSLTITVTQSCTLSASPSSIVLGSSSTLTASCSPAAAGYNWHGACAGTTSTCVVTPVAAGTPSYTVTGTGANTATSAPVTVTVAAPSCALSASSTAIAVGETSTLTASCTPAASGYTWTGGTCVGNITYTCIVTPGVTTPYTVTGVGANVTTSNTVTVAVVAPYCTVTPSPASIVLGATSTLTASCHPAPAANGYTWTGGTCAANITNTCTVTPAVAPDPTTYTVIGTGIAAPSAPLTVTVAPPSCTLSASPTSITLGASSTLTASCTPLATSYNWHGACAGTTSTCVVTPAAAGTPSYTVTGVGANTTTSNAVTVTVSSTPCTTSAITWSAGLAAYPGGTPKHTINVGQNQAYSQTMSSHSSGYHQINYGSCLMDISISVNRCEWSATLAANSCQNSGGDPRVDHRTSDFPTVPSACMLAPGTTYYINVRQRVPEVNGCAYYLSY